jgi:hypothetical protein
MQDEVMRYARCAGQADRRVSQPASDPVSAKTSIKVPKCSKLIVKAHFDNNRFNPNPGTARLLRPHDVGGDELCILLRCDRQERGRAQDHRF